MEMSLNIDTSKLKRFLLNKTKDFFRIVKEEFGRAGWYFIGHIVLTQLSGRIRPDYGLNVITGTLRRSFRSRVIASKEVGDVAIKIYSGVPYADVHQFGYEKKNIPKRIYVIEEFKTKGVVMLADAIRKAIKETSK